MTISDYPRVIELPDGAQLTVRPLCAEDGDRLLRFFQSLPDEDRVFMEHDVRQRELVEDWVRNIDYDRVFPLLALNDSEVVADVTLHLSPEGWMRHVGEIRMSVAPRFRDRGLRRLLARELASRALELGLEKIQYLAFQGHGAAVTLCQRLGLTRQATIPGLLKDWRGRKHSMVVMVDDVDEFAERVERVIHTMGVKSKSSLSSCR